MILPVIYAGIGVAFFMILVCLTRRPFSSANRVITLLMIFLSLPMIFKFNDNLLSSGAKDLVGFFRLSPLLFGPLLYLYVMIMTGEMHRFNMKRLFHFAPFVLAVVILLSAGSDGAHLRSFARPGPDVSIEFSHGKFPSEKSGGESGFPVHSPRHLPFPPSVSNNSNQLPEAIELKYDQAVNGIIKASILISLFCYTIAILVLLRRHYKKVSDYYSYNSIMVNLDWLKWITVFFFLSYGFVICASFVSPVYIFHPFLDPFYTPDIATTFFIFAFCLFAIRQPVIFDSDGGISEKENGESGSPQGKNGRKYKKSGLKEADEIKFFKMLENHMQSEKPYLDSDLTIVDLAVKLNIPKNYVTEIINKRFKNNFFMYINYFRIEEAKKKLSDEMYGEHSIIRIAYDCGFNSKSTFNSVFKKFTEVTPSDYRRYSRQKESLL